MMLLCKVSSNMTVKSCGSNTDFGYVCSHLDLGDISTILGVIFNHVKEKSTPSKAVYANYIGLLVMSNANCEGFPICNDRITENDRCVVKINGIHRV